jgi:dipeptidyl aminopeptidase/acylaminoacyl peptidase
LTQGGAPATRRSQRAGRGVRALAAAVLAGALLGAAPAMAASHRLEALDPDSGAVRVLAQSRLGWDGLQATVDGRSLLVFRSDRAHPRVRRRIDLLSGRQVPLPVVGESSGSFSPDGSRVIAPVDPADTGEMVLRTIAGRPLARLRPRSADLSMRVTWTADSRVLAVSDPRDETRTHFRIRLVDGRSGRVLAAQALDGGEPVLLPQSFSPAGDRLVLSIREARDPLAGPTLVMDVRTGAVRRIGAEHGGFTLPAWSPDGRRIALRRLAGGVAILDAATGATERVIPTPGAVAANVTWSPDGTRVAYTLVPPQIFCLSCLFSPDGPPRISFAAGLTVADAATGAVRVVVPRGTRDVGDVVWTRDGRALIADVEG